MLANSRPATPAPIMASFLGMVSKFKAAIVSIIYLLSIGMKSDLESISPNRLVFALAPFSEWISGRVSFEVIGPSVISFITDDFNPLYNRSDSFQLCIGDVTHSANAAIAWIRFFDYELESVDIVRDCTNSWERIYTVL